MLGCLSVVPATWAQDAAATVSVASVEMKHPGVYPIFKRAPQNAAFAIKVGGQGSGVLPEMTITLEVSDPEAVEKIHLRAGDEKGLSFKVDEVLGSGEPDDEGKVKISCPAGAPAGTWLWFDVVPSEEALVGGLVTFSDIKVKAGERDFKPQQKPVTQRIGYLVGVPKETVDNQPDGAAPRMCKAFRIPGLIRTKKGSLVGCFDARYTREGDLCADIDVAVVRSEDGGQTWTAPFVGMDSGPGEANGCGDPCILQDPKTGRIWMQALACHFKGGASLNVSKTGFDPSQTGQWEMTFSDDDGKTWSKEHVNPTKDIKKEEWTTILAGPGNGIVTRKGVIVFPAQIWQRGANPRCMSTICYSKDGGKTWHYGNGVPHATSECQVVELKDGSIMINCRNEARQGKRIVYVSKDLGDSWEPHSTNNKDLREPTCQGSLIRAKTKKGNFLLFSNPNSGGRNNMTIRYSKDEGDSWSEGYLYDNRQCMGYSSLALIDGNTVGVFYETCHTPPGHGPRGIGFLRFPLESILTGKDLPVKVKADKKGKKSKKAKKRKKKSKKSKKND